MSNQEIIKTKEGNWFLTVTRNMSFWHQYLSSLGHYVYSKDFDIDVPIKQLAIVRDGTYTSIFCDTENNQKYFNAVYEKIMQKDGIEDLSKKYSLYAQELIFSLDNLNQDINIKNWKDFTYRYARMCAGLYLTSAVGRIGMEKLQAKLVGLDFSTNQIQEFIPIITYPEKHTPLFNSQLKLLEIAKSIQNKEEIDIEKSLQEWINNFGFIPVNFCEEPWTIEDARSQLDSLLKIDCVEEIIKLDAEHKEKINLRKDLINKINNTEIQLLANALAESTLLNEFRKNVFSRVSLNYRPVFAKVANMAGSTNWRDCFYLSPNEMEEIIEGKPVNLSDLVSSRKTFGCVVDNGGNVRLLSENEIKLFADYVSKTYGVNIEEASEQTEISGSVASRGKTTGVVKVVLSSKDFNKIERGDILVTTMTSVDFVPVMEKAAAFVTNEGGITSHAAIVAREMNKPCIIGTKIATKVLKDGDMVEVDADNGIVRIIP